MTQVNDDEAPATKRDIKDMVTLMMGTMVDVETRFDGLETRFDTLETRFHGLEIRFDTLETRFDGLENSLDTKLNDLEHRLLLSNEQTRQDVIDMYKDTLSSHDDRITTLELIARAPRAL